VARHPAGDYAGGTMLQSWLMTMRDGGVNLAAIVAWIFFAIGTIPLVFFLGLRSARRELEAPAPESGSKKKSS
jgi:hypothetical protein